MVSTIVTASLSIPRRLPFVYSPLILTVVSSQASLAISEHLKSEYSRSLSSSEAPTQSNEGLLYSEEPEEEPKILSCSGVSEWRSLRDQAMAQCLEVRYRYFYLCHILCIDITILKPDTLLEANNMITQGLIQRTAAAAATSPPPLREPVSEPVDGPTDFRPPALRLKGPSKDLNAMGEACSEMRQVLEVIHHHLHTLATPHPNHDSDLPTRYSRNPLDALLFDPLLTPLYIQGTQRQDRRHVHSLIEGHLRPQHGSFQHVGGRITR